MPVQRVQDLTPITDPLATTDLMHVVVDDITSSTGKGDRRATMSDLQDLVTGNGLDDLNGMIRNVGIKATCSANAMTIELKQKDGVTDPDIQAQRCRIAFRGPITDGSFSIVDADGPISTVISSGSTAGHIASTSEPIYVYAINNASVIELAWSASNIFDESKLQDTTAEGGAGGADNRYTLYSTAARIGVAIRLIGKLTINQTTPGTWVNNPSKIDCSPIYDRILNMSCEVTTTAPHGSSTTTQVPFTDSGAIKNDIFSICATNGRITPKINGRYLLTGSWWGNAGYFLSIYKNGAFNKTLSICPVLNQPAGFSRMIYLTVGDYIDFRLNGSATVTVLELDFQLIEKSL